jgi:hypothetical protein
MTSKKPFLIAFAVIFIGSLASVARAEERVLVIAENTQATIDDLKLAAYNCREDRTCALRIFVRDDSSKNQQLRVHAGQTFSASGKTFEVLEVESAQVRIALK